MLHWVAAAKQWVAAMATCCQQRSAPCILGTHYTSLTGWHTCSSPPSADSPGGLQSLEQKIRRKAPAAVQQLLSHEATLEGMRRRSQVPLLVLPNTRACDADYPTHHARVSGQPRVPCSLHPGTTQSALWMSCIMPTSYSHRPQAIDIQPGAATRRDSAMLRRLRARLRQGPSRAQQPSWHSRHRPSRLS